MRRDTLRQIVFLSPEQRDREYGTSSHNFTIIHFCQEELANTLKQLGSISNF